MAITQRILQPAYLEDCTEHPPYSSEELGRIHIYTGYCSSGKSTTVRQKHASNPVSSYFEETPYYCRVRTMLGALGEVGRQICQRKWNDVEHLTDIIRKVTSKQMMRDALRNAKQGRDVYLDIAAHPNIGELLPGMMLQAEKEHASANVSWVTCSPQERRKRCETRGTRFDKELLQSSFFDVVPKIEGPLLAKLKSTLPIEIVHNRQQTPPVALAHSASRSRAKNIPYVAKWIARIYDREFRRKFSVTLG